MSGFVRRQFGIRRLLLWTLLVAVGIMAYRNVYLELEYRSPAMEGMSSRFHVYFEWSPLRLHVSRSDRYLALEYYWNALQRKAWVWWAGEPWFIEQ